MEHVPTAKGVITPLALTLNFEQLLVEYVIAPAPVELFPVASRYPAVVPRVTGPALIEMLGSDAHVRLCGFLAIEMLTVLLAAA
jgi:hypothetical protein